MWNFACLSRWHVLRAIIERRFLCACQAVSVMWGALSVMWGVGETHCWMCTSDYYLCVAQIMSDASPGHGGCATNKGSTVQEMEIQATSLAAVQQVQLMTITFFFPNLWHYPFIFKFNSRKLSIVCITKSMDSKAPLTNYWAKEQSAVRRLFKKQQNKNVHTNILWEFWGQFITNVWPTNCNIGQVMVGTCTVDDHCRTIPIIPLTRSPAPSSQLAGQI